MQTYLFYHLHHLRPPCLPVKWRAHRSLISHGCMCMEEANAKYLQELCCSCDPLMTRSEKGKERENTVQLGYLPAINVPASMRIGAMGYSSSPWITLGVDDPGDSYKMLHSAKTCPVAGRCCLNLGHIYLYSQIIMNTVNLRQHYKLYKSSHSSNWGASCSIPLQRYRSRPFPNTWIFKRPPSTYSTKPHQFK